MARKNVEKNTFDSTLANQKTGKTIEKPLKELPWNQQFCSYIRAFTVFFLMSWLPLHYLELGSLLCEPNQILQSHRTLYGASMCKFQKF